MSTQLDQAIAGVGVSSTLAGAAGVPEVKVSSADAPQGARRAEENRSGPSNDAVGSEKGLLSRAAKFGGAVAAYAIAGVLGWQLYGLVAPLNASWPEIVARMAPKSEPLAEPPPLTQKLVAEIQALQARVDALEKALGAETKQRPVDDLNERIDFLKKETEAQIAAVSDRVMQLQRDKTATDADPAPRRFASETGDKGPKTVSTRDEGAKTGRHVRRRRGDAFDPSLHPAAPGAPRPLRLGR